jgi:hypothetical protein
VGEGGHPLAYRDTRQDVVDQVRGAVGHAAGSGLTQQEGQKPRPLQAKTTRSSRP